MMSGRRGRFITLEGGEGVGKSTQVKALAAKLRDRGLDVLETREPGGTPGAEHIRQLLLHSAANAWSPRAEALLFAAARSDHVERLIEPALAAGKWVLCDRFVDSTRAYQGGNDGLSDAEILTLHGIGSNDLLPDRTLLLTLGAEAIATRRAARHLDQPDRFEDRQTDFHTGVNAAFDRIADADPSRFRRISAAGAPDDVAAQLLDALADLL